MKFKLSKKILTVLFCLMSVMAVLCFVGCGEKAGGTTNDGGDPSTGDNGGNGGNGGSGGDSGSDYKPSIEIKLDASESVIQTTRPNTASSDIISADDLSELFTKKYTEDLTKKYSSRTEALDNIFNPDVLGQTVLVFDRSEWDKHLYYWISQRISMKTVLLQKDFILLKTIKNGLSMILDLEFVVTQVVDDHKKEMELVIMTMFKHTLLQILKNGQKMIKSLKIV